MSQGNFSVFIEGKKEGFNSKNAIEIFKSIMKKDNETDVSTLSKRFLKENYEFYLAEKTPERVRVEIREKQVVNKEKPVSTRDMLKAKLNIMKQSRTNNDYYRAKSNSKVSSEILDEYMKLKKIAKIPIPEPTAVLNSPDEYKPIVSMVLSNEMSKSLGANHPYVRYFKLLGEAIGVTKPLPLPKDMIKSMSLPKQENISEESKENITSHMTLPRSFNELVKKAGVQETKGVQMTGDVETDSDTDTSDEEN